MYKVKLKLLSLLGLTLLPAVTHAAPIKSITLDVGTPSINTTTWALTDNGVVFDEKNLDRLAVGIPWIGTGTVPGNTTKFLRFVHNQPTAAELADPTKIKSRTEYYFGRNLTTNTDYYVGFRFMIGGAASDIQGWTIISQWQQQGVYIEPFVNLNLLAVGGNIELHSHIRNDDYNQNGGGTLGQFINKTISTSIAPWTWYNITVHVKANPTNTSGVVRFWLNGTALTGLTFNGKVGYSNTEVPGISSSFQQTFGIYRQKQNSMLKMYFDDYKLGSTYADVN